MRKTRKVLVKDSTGDLEILPDHLPTKPLVLDGFSVRSAVCHEWATCEARWMYAGLEKLRIFVLA